MRPVDRIDLNCDMGEGGRNDAALMPYITSANIACGAHAGDPSTMRATVRAALSHGVAIGAHPGYADRAGFGRRATSPPADVHRLIHDQLASLHAIATVEGAELQHVKPHGALYNAAATDEELAGAIASAVADFDERLLLFGLSGSVLIEAALQRGLSVAREAFADRTYRPDGTLTPRSEPGSMITDPERAVAQVLSIVEGRVGTGDGLERAAEAETICIHGDTPNAPAIAMAVRTSLERAGVEVAGPTRR